MASVNISEGFVMGKKRVLVAMSGGVDSSLSAIRLHEAGYEVVGLTMKTWDYTRLRGDTKERGCCSLDAIHDAREVAVALNIPHYVLDIQDMFGHYVTDYFKREYLAGRTPNPCVVCNTHVKWDILLAKADAWDCDYVATGHYARVRQEGRRYVLSKGVDLRKDQSYALWGVRQEALARTLFPMGSLTKEAAKRLMEARGFGRLAEKSESYEICFIPEGDYRNWLQANAPEVADIGEGKLLCSDGREVGKHKGYPYYTIGQRRGLEVALGYPAYVVDIRPEANEVVIGRLDELQRQGMYVRDIHWSKYEDIPADTMDVTTKIRYNDKGRRSVIARMDHRRCKVFFGQEGAFAVTPGQAAVFYANDDLIGGGWIESAFGQKNA